MKRISEVAQNVDLVEIDGRQIYLVGTAHVSRESADVVESTMREVRPDTVCVELCESRYDSLKDPSRWSNTDIFDVIKSGRAYVLMSQLALAGFQKKIASRFDIRPGEEMRRAIEVGEELGVAVSLVDRNVRTTLKRAWAKAGLWSISKVVVSIIGSLFVADEISEEDIERLKTGDVLNEVIGEFSDLLPGVKEALIDERDKYMASKILSSPGDTVVAVLGAGHIPGIKRHIGENINTEELEQIPPRSPWLVVLAWTIPVIVLAIFAYGFTVTDRETSMQMILSWILANGSLSALGAIIALAHPATVITAFIAAPITSLNPTLAAGWFCGLVEALIRKPRVKDLESIGDDITSVKGIWTNRVSKVLLVIILANIGSIIGTYVGVFYIGALLFGG